MDFVLSLCARLDIPALAGQGDAPGYAREKGVSIECAARELRYAFLCGAMEKTGARVCATAHHLDDQAETLLMRLARGALDGLKGIPYVNGPFVRPLRDVSKAQILRYARENGIGYVRDETKLKFRT
jgi:tRNA(Ile)-lysidine synthase